MKKIIVFAIVVIAVVLGLNFSKKGKVVKSAMISYVVPTSLLNEEGITVNTRVNIPEGYQRVRPEQGTFSYYVHNYNLKPYGTEVINYDGKPYWYQAGHVGVLDVPVPSNGLQQCADALIRIRSEYLWATNRKEEIGFKFTSGHYCSWSKYAQGYRPTINGNNVNFSKKAAVNHSKENFYNYLNLIYTYAGTYSLSQELKKVQGLKDVQVGDMLIYPGFPGHVMMVGDIVENDKGERLFLFFQGNTPAQSVHMIKNASNTSISPWYSLDGKKSLDTPIYTFESFTWVRF